MSELACAVRAAKAAGTIIKKSWGHSVTVRSKHLPGDFLTKVDEACDATITKIIRKQFPHDEIVSEESAAGAVPARGRVWVVDPLDGTANFVHSIPLVCPMVAFVEDGVPRAGAVYNPILDELFSARSGNGAFKNGKRIHVSRTRSVRDVFMASGLPPLAKKDRTHVIGNLMRLHKNVTYVYALNSAGIAASLVAQGSLDAYLSYKLMPWDVAAPSIIVREAGGTVTSLGRNALNLNDRRFIFSNGKVHGALQKVK